MRINHKPLFRPFIAGAVICNHLLGIRLLLFYSFFSTSGEKELACDSCFLTLPYSLVVAASPETRKLGDWNLLLGKVRSIIALFDS